jgi:hypothetical protein
MLILSLGKKPFGGVEPLLSLCQFPLQTVHPLLHLLEPRGDIRRLQLEGLLQISDRP